MKKLTLLILAAGTFALALQARAETITFEDLSGAGTVPANYHGLTWTNWSYYDDVQPPYFPSSGVERIYNNPRFNNNLIEFNQSVTFLGLWIAGLSHGQYVIGYSSGNPIFTSAPQAGDNSDFGNF